MNTIELLHYVTRIEGDYSVYGNRGTVIDLDKEAGRARIQWDDKTYRNRDGELCSVKVARTWIKLNSLTIRTLTDSQIEDTRASMRASSEARFEAKYGHLE